MYKQHFGFTELPFSIVPNSRFLYQSPRHKEAILRLTAGLGEGGGFAMLTGEVGTGKTTVARAMLNALDNNVHAGLILNPTFSNLELLEAICDEFGLEYQADSSLKQLNHVIHEFLLSNHANGIQTLLVIDEAQHLSAEVLEQLRLLTNLETESQKLLKVLLIGQPELQHKLTMPQLRQLAQRITGRYHLLPLEASETANYIRFRLELAGGDKQLFSAKALKLIAQQTSGIPRLINLVCDAALKQAYGLGENPPNFSSVQAACYEVMSFQANFQPAKSHSAKPVYLTYAAAAVIGALLAVGSYLYTPRLIEPAMAEWGELNYPAQPAEVIEKEVFPEFLTQQLSLASDFEAGVGDLYKVWGFKPSMLDKLCLQENEGAFRCESLSGDIQTLRAANTPVLLTLEHEGVMSFAVLYRLNHQVAQLLIGDKNIELPLARLDQLWNGEYHRIWRRYWQQTLKVGMSGETIALLDDRLSQVLGQPNSSNNVYDQALQDKVKAFQRWQGLTVDGIAGKKTLQRLEEVAQVDAPTLQMAEGI